MQIWIVAIAVAWCSLYAVWTLMPGAARRAIALHLLRLPVPKPLRSVLERARQPTGACGGCDSCGSTPKPIKIHRR